VSALRSFLDVRRREVPFVVPMFLYFFLFITAFWILKPLKKTLFLGFYGREGRFDLFGWSLPAADAELIAKVCNMVVAFVAMMAFTLAARRLHRHKLTFLFGAFSLLCFAAYAVLLAGGGEVTVWSFYLFGDLFNTLMLASFFAFLNDSVAPGDTKRLYGPIVLGGVAGGAFGSLFVAAQIDNLSINEWLYLSMGLTVLLMAMAAIAGRWVEHNPPPVEAPTPEPTAKPASRSALAGVGVVMRSRYLLAIVTIVALYEIISTILDYQFTRAVTHYVPLALGADASAEDVKAAIGQQFSTVYAITNSFALLVQVFATSFVMKRFGVRIALLVMPLAILSNSAVFLALPLLWVGSFLNTSDNGLNYSLNQSARESLYTPVRREDKYAAKAFIDMFVVRVAKAIAVGLSLAMSAIFTDFSGVRWLSVIAIVLTVVWLLSASYAGRQFQQLTGAKAPPDPTA